MNGDTWLIGQAKRNRMFCEEYAFVPEFGHTGEYTCGSRAHSYCGYKNIPMATSFICDTSVHYTEIGPDPLDMRHEGTIGREHTLMLQWLAVLFEPLLRHTVADENRRVLRSSQGFAQLIRGTVIDDELFDQLAILCMQCRDT